MHNVSKTPSFLEKTHLMQIKTEVPWDGRRGAKGDAPWPTKTPNCGFNMYVVKLQHVCCQAFINGSYNRLRLKSYWVLGIALHLLRQLLVISRDTSDGIEQGNRVLFMLMRILGWRHVRATWAKTRESPPLLEETWPQTEKREQNCNLNSSNEWKGLPFSPQPIEWHATVVINRVLRRYSSFTLSTLQSGKWLRDVETTNRRAQGVRSELHTLPNKKGTKILSSPFYRRATYFLPHILLKT